MTTNVLDKRNARVTSDSRWSVDDAAGGYVYYVDNTHFDKIAERSTAVMICAGDAELIDQWKQWFVDEDAGYEAPPSHLQDLQGNVIAAITVTVITKPGFAVDFSEGLYHRHEDSAYFCGSGGAAAKDCYSVNGCSFRCVDSASVADPFTGGDVKYYDVSSFENNLSNPKASLQDMLDQLVDRGFAMNKTTREITPMSPLTQEELRQKLANGTLSASAPTGVPLRGWSDRARHDAQEAMRRIVEREKAANGE
ncbi:hypothetical protein [Stenotrophomonas sp.]|uniref:hypothetical protein n=1 Tax=Stenotrophomonas sp. TaxID=69392 RepID=UPI0028B18481|nr:hypothetical protein [Stenotrophomonas sp.]